MLCNGFASIIFNWLPDNQMKPYLGGTHPEKIQLAWLTLYLAHEQPTMILLNLATALCADV